MIQAEHLPVDNAFDGHDSIGRPDSHKDDSQ